MNSDSKYFQSYYQYVNKGIRPESKELEAVFKIISDLKDRRGIKQEFNNIDGDIQDEIVEQWLGCIKSTLSQESEKNQLQEELDVEQSHYVKLTKFQKDLVDSLKSIGFTHKYFSTYELLGWGVISVDKFDKLSDVLKFVHEQGKDQKRFEIQRALGI